MISALAMLLTIGVAHAELEDNQGYRDAYTGWSAVHLAVLPTSFLPGPPGVIAEVIGIGIDIQLKRLEAYFIAPSPAPVLPTTSDQCYHEFTLPQLSASYQNLLGIADIDFLPANWGSLGTPLVRHANSEVKVEVSAGFINIPPNTDPDKVKNLEVSVPGGEHSVTWNAHTQLDVLFDVVIPGALFYITNKLKYSKAFFDVQTDPKTAARALEIGLLFLLNAAIETGVVTAGAALDAIPINSATHRQIRTFTVLDTQQPLITSGITQATVEATDLGGERWERQKDFFTSFINASDPCGLPISVSNNAPVLLPLGTNVITWTASDPRPVGGNNSGQDTVTQTIIVEDTKAPILLAPPSRVVESVSAISSADFDLGTAVTFDLADPEVLVTHDAPVNFPANSRTEIIWEATDSSANMAEKSQWITVKAPGTNTPPFAFPNSAQTLTSQPVDIELFGLDSDMIDGIFDPLRFDITNLPDNGFFVAPLVPYFIEDYRVSPTDEVGGILATANNRAAALEAAFCDQSRDIPVDFVYQPEFVHVTDDGISYVLDQYWQCGSTLPVPRPRISKWDINGNLIDQANDVSADVDRIVMDRDGFLYLVSPETSSLDFSFAKMDADLNRIDLWRMGGSLGVSRSRFVAAEIDLLSGIIYVTDRLGLFAFDSNDVDGSDHPAFLGKLNTDGNIMAGQSVISGSSGGYTVEVDSTGAVYVTGSTWDRIHKFAPATVNNGVLNGGSYIGWLGRCDSGPNCDDENGRSFGYSCTDTACNVSDTEGPLQGQLDEPLGIALDPDDILYVTDYNNARVQRFTPLGDFAGEAASTCDGTCFVLGDMGRPLDISVNSTQFFVLDRDRDLMHVFETAPFKEITEDSVIVSYASDNDFQGTDQFSFRVHDGLVYSAPANVTVNVARNFRAPLAEDLSVVTNEDNALNITLPATDPDGILGVDFNGLDTLSFQIISAPQHGALSGSGANRIYTPDPDYNGPDSFVFRAFDGVDYSNEATVSITVNPVNDAPTVSLTDQTSKIVPRKFWPLLANKIAVPEKRIGLGFPVPLMAEYTDPDQGQRHFLQIAWGDGEVESANDLPPNDPDNHSDPILTQTFQGIGQIIAGHTYLSAGQRTINILVFDEDAADGELNVPVTVVPMVDLSLEIISQPEDPVYPGQPITLTIQITNETPATGVTGLNAGNVVFTASVPDGVQLLSVQSSKGGCQHVAPQTTCTLGQMTVGEQQTITVTLLPGENFDPSQFPYQLDVISDQEDASGDNIFNIEIPVLSQRIFDDNFETQ